MVVDQLGILLTTPEIIVANWRAARAQDSGRIETEVPGGPVDFVPHWEELFPSEQARIVQLLVERVDVTGESAAIRVRTDGLAS